MDRILISSLIGFMTYMVLNVYQPSEKFGQSGGNFGGAKKKAEKEEKNDNPDEQYPLCYEICGLAKKVYNDLKKNGLQETEEFKDIARLYSRIFCLEMALGNNSEKEVKENKVNKELENYRKYYNMDDTDNVQKFINDTFNKTERLIKKISKDEDLIKTNSQIKEIHDDEINKLLKKFLKK